MSEIPDASDATYWLHQFQRLAVNVDDWIRTGKTETALRQIGITWDLWVDAVNREHQAEVLKKQLELGQWADAAARQHNANAARDQHSLRHGTGNPVAKDQLGLAARDQHALRHGTDNPDAERWAKIHSWFSQQQITPDDLIWFLDEWCRIET